MKYAYRPSVLNRRDSEGFKEHQKFIGILLPDGSPFLAQKKHVWKGLESCLYSWPNMIVDFFDKNPKGNIEEYLNNVLDFDNSNEIVALLSYYIKDLVLSDNGDEKISSLAGSIQTIVRKDIEGVDKKKLPEDQGGLAIKAGSREIYFKDFLVSALGCHYVSATDSTIFTAAPNWAELFEEYINAGAKIVPVEQFVYSNEEHRFVLETPKKTFMDFHRESKREEELGESTPNFDYYGDAPKVR